MATVTVIPTDMATVLQAIQDRLVAWLEWPEVRVIIDARTDRDHEMAGPPQAEQYLRLQIKNRSLVQETVEARGRIQPFMKATISVVVRTRVNLDTVISDESALTVASRGHLPAEHLVWDALICFQPMDEEENWLVTEPIKPRGGNTPNKSPKDWMQSVIDFDITFPMDLTQTYQ